MDGQQQEIKRIIIYWAGGGATAYNSLEQALADHLDTHEEVMREWFGIIRQVEEVIGRTKQEQSDG